MTRAPFRSLKQPAERTEAHFPLTLIPLLSVLPPTSFSNFCLRSKMIYNTGQAAVLLLYASGGEASIPERQSQASSDKKKRHYRDRSQPELAGEHQAAQKSTSGVSQVLGCDIESGRQAGSIP